MMNLGHGLVIVPLTCHLSSSFACITVLSSYYHSLLAFRVRVTKERESRRKKSTLPLPLHRNVAPRRRCDEPYQGSHGSCPIRCRAAHHLRTSISQSFRVFCQSDAARLTTRHLSDPDQGCLSPLLPSVEANPWASRSQGLGALWGFLCREVEIAPQDARRPSEIWYDTLEGCTPCRLLAWSIRSLIVMFV
jgi:hypothetical protein